MGSLLDTKHKLSLPIVWNPWSKELSHNSLCSTNISIQKGFKVTHRNDEVFIFKVRPVYTLSAWTIKVGDVTSLDYTLRHSYTVYIKSAYFSNWILHKTGPNTNKTLFRACWNSNKLLFNNWIRTYLIKGHLIPEILQLEHTISTLYNRIVTTYIQLVPTLSHVSTLLEDAISTQIGIKRSEM